ncbi:MAG: sigma-70 family RNA polymerase sigma factor [Alphaproteobacteria bacterium]
MTAGDERADLHFRRLMRAAQEGDHASYDRLLREILPLIRGMIRKRRTFLPSEDIEDLVQDVLLSLHSVLATYDPERPFIPWLMAITRNRLADGGRRHARLNANEVTVERLPETFCDAEANRGAETFADRESLRRAMTELPPGQRQALDLLKLKELSLKEASAISGMSISALKVAVHRATKTLRNVLKREM